MKKLLITSYWIGIIADAIASLLLFSPTIVGLILQPKPFELSPVYLYVSRIAGALMLGWTVLLYWAQRKPVERVDILLIMLFPVVAVLAGAAVLVAISEAVSAVNLLPMFVLFGTYIPSSDLSETAI